MRKREGEGYRKRQNDLSTIKRNAEVQDAGSFALSLQYLHRLAFSLIVHAAQCCLLSFALMVFKVNFQQKKARECCILL